MTMPSTCVTAGERKASVTTSREVEQCRGLYGDLAVASRLVRVKPAWRCQERPSLTVDRIGSLATLLTAWFFVGLDLDRVTEGRSRRGIVFYRHCGSRVVLPFLAGTLGREKKRVRRVLHAQRFDTAKTQRRPPILQSLERSCGTCRITLSLGDYT